MSNEPHPASSTMKALVLHAQRVNQLPQNENARSNLLIRLQLCNDGTVLRQVAAKFPFHPAVAVPVWRRIAAVENDNPASLVEAAGVMYSMGLDDEALELLVASLELNKEFIPAWELKAALCPDAAERRAIYEQILKIDPGNRTAVDNLIVLGRPKG